MKKIYSLKTCNSCQSILKELDLPIDFELQDIKETNISAKDLDTLKTLSGSYKALFSKRAKLFKEMGLKNEILQESDYRHYILNHYTFLKRPILVFENQVFIGNSSKTTAAAKLASTNE